MEQETLQAYYENLELTSQQRSHLVELMTDVECINSKVATKSCKEIKGENNEELINNRLHRFFYEQNKNSRIISTSFTSEQERIIRWKVNKIINVEDIHNKEL